MNYRMISYVLGWIMVFEAAFMAVPLITAAVFAEGNSALWFGVSAAVCLIIGGLLILVKKPQNKRLFSREGFVIVALSWILLSLFGALPLFLSGAIPSFIDALFETVSGFTTTGASILSDVEALPKSMIMWRSFTHWVGGMGVLVFIMAFLPLSGGQNMHIMKAESPGPSVSKLVPRVKTTALLLYSIYFVLTLVEFVMLLCGGMSLFDSLTISFGTAGTGGLGIKNDSMASYSPYLQWVVTIFMILFGVNFNAYYLMLCNKFRKGFGMEEVRCYFTIVGVSTLVIFFNILHFYSIFTNLNLTKSAGCVYILIIVNSIISN